MRTGTPLGPLLFCAVAVCGRTLLTLACSIATSTTAMTGRTATPAGAFALRPMAVPRNLSRAAKAATAI